MSRTNPNKRKRRSAKQTQLVFGEGLEDKEFLKLLRGYYSQDSGTHSKVDCGSGGTPKNVIEEAVRKANGSKTIVVVDWDKSKKEHDEAEAALSNYSNVTLIKIDPCMEALLLAVLDSNGAWPKGSSSECKKTFEKMHIDAKQRRNMLAYLKKFPKKLLDSKRKKINKLNELINIFSGH